MNLSRRTKRELILQINRLKTELAMLGQRDAHVEENFHEMQEIQERFDLFFYHAPIGMAILNRSYQYLAVNPPLAELNQRPMYEHIGRSIQDVNPIAARISLPIIRSVFRTGMPAVNTLIESPGEPESGKPIRAFRMSVHPIFKGEDEPVCVGVIVEPV